MKSHLRTHMKNILRILPRAHFEEANLKLRNNITSDPRWEFVTRVCSYTNFKNELPTSAFNLEVVSSGRELLLPEVTSDKTLTMKPANQIKVERGLTLVLVPGLAFSPGGFRLGRGWGCYDRFIREMRGDPSIIFTGVCFQCQFIESVPQDPWDAPLQEILVI